MPDMETIMENTGIKKSVTKSFLAVIGVLLIGFVGGCTSDKSVRTYLQALLDTSYKNDSKAFVEIRLGDEQDAQTLYE